MYFNTIFANFDPYFYLWSFFIYAFLGWCTEVAFAAVHSGKFVNRGFLNGPVCPIYGLGMVIIILFLTPLKENTFLLFIGASILTTLLELVTGVILEKCFQQKWWNYQDRPFNIGGYICLEFAIIWGLACLLVMELLHPTVEWLIGLIPIFLGKILLAILFSVMFADIIVTVASLTKLNRRLKLIEDLSAALRKTSDNIGENIYKTTANAMEKKDLLEQKGAELKDTALLKKEEHMEEAQYHKAMLEKNIENNVENLKAKLAQTLEHKNILHNRLLKAFPNMQSKRHKESLEQLKQYIKNMENK